MLPAGETVQLYVDDAKLQGKKSIVKLNKKRELQITMPCNGGFVIVE